MNQELESRWRRADPPFDGRVMHLQADAVTLPALRSALRLLAPILQSAVSTQICINEDWHDHDGFLCPSKGVSWGELDSWLLSDDTLASHQHGDFAVHWAVHDLDYRFLLRFYLDDERPVSECDLDLCATESVLRTATARLADEGISTCLSPAKDYFDQAYGG